MTFPADRLVLRGMFVVAMAAVAGCRQDSTAPTATASTTESAAETPLQNLEPAPAVSGSAISGPPATAGATPAPAVSSDEPPIQPVFRPDDDRPVHDVAALERVGIRRYASTRLILFTDISPGDARVIPPLVDALYDELVNYFGELPPARDGSEFQITGYLMDETDRFAAAGLLPDDLPPFNHGRHRGQRFWMREQDYDYYRRHLLLHEATHCFMTRLPGSVGPEWYMEGMAELFGTHALSGESERSGQGVRFRVMPTSPEASAGSGRITLVRDAVARDKFLTLDDVAAIPSAAFLENDAYAWSWAACYFLDQHPRYRDRFRELGDPALRQRFAPEFRRRFEKDVDDLRTEWTVFAHSLRYGYDLANSAIEFRGGESLPEAGETVTIAASGGWQSSGILVEPKRRYRITTEGRFTLAEMPQRWTSDAGGISFDYFDGRPIGRLLAAVLVDDPGNALDPASGLLSPIDVGKDATIESPAAGTLYFRLNDRWDRLDDNRGQVHVTIHPVTD